MAEIKKKNQIIYYVHITIKNIFLDDSLQYNSLRNPVHYLLYCVEATSWSTSISELVQFNVVKFCISFMYHDKEIEILFYVHDFPSDFFMIVS